MQIHNSFAGFSIESLYSLLFPVHPVKVLQQFKDVTCSLRMLLHPLPAAHSLSYVLFIFCILPVMCAGEDTVIVRHVQY